MVQAVLAHRHRLRRKMVRMLLTPYLLPAQQLSRLAAARRAQQTPRLETLLAVWAVHTPSLEAWRLHQLRTVLTERLVNVQRLRTRELLSLQQMQAQAVEAVGVIAPAASLAHRAVALRMKLAAPVAHLRVALVVRLLITDLRMLAQVAVVEQVALALQQVVSEALDVKVAAVAALVVKKAPSLVRVTRVALAEMDIHE
jgi:hypothetical protein